MERWEYIHPRPQTNVHTVYKYKYACLDSKKQSYKSGPASLKYKAKTHRLTDHNIPGIYERIAMKIGKQLLLRSKSVS